MVIIISFLGPQTNEFSQQCLLQTMRQGCCARWFSCTTLRLVHPRWKGPGDPWSVFRKWGVRFIYHHSCCHLFWEYFSCSLGSIWCPFCFLFDSVFGVGCIKQQSHLLLSANPAGIETPEENPHMHIQLIFNKRTESNPGKKCGPLNKCCNNWIAACSSKKQDCYLSLCTKMKERT